MRDTLNILIVEDHYALRFGVVGILSSAFEAVEFGEAVNAQEAIDKLHEREWDAVIIDIGLPGRSGLDVLKEVKQSWPKLPAIIYSMHDEEQFAVRALKLGAASYLRKDGIYGELVNAVKAALAGRKYLTPRIAESLALHLQDDYKGAMHESLSNREYQILCMIGRGKTVKEIGAELFLSPKTVSTYRCRILKKLHMSNNSQLMHYAVRNQLLEPQQECA